MRVMLDTNIVLDVLLDRELFSENSATVLRLCEQRKIEGFISASSVTDIFYLIKKHLHSMDDAYEAIGLLLGIVNVADVTAADVLAAFRLKAKDFEDCLVATCARSAACDCIVTRNVQRSLPRNKNDFAGLAVPAITPEEFLAG